MATVPFVEDGQYLDPVAALNPIRFNIRAGLEHRKGFEPIWNSNLAWAKGQHWHVWDRDTRTLRRIQDVDPKYRNRELYSVDLITEYRTTVLGELASDDQRPQLLLQQDSPAAEQIQEQLNKAVGYAWDFEIEADEVLAEVDRLTLDLGTSAVRCRFDPLLGPPAGEMPYMNGMPVMGDQATELMSQYQGGPIPGVEMREIPQGKIVLEPLSAFNLITPPGVTHERYFPWECVVRPAYLPDVEAEFEVPPGMLREDTDIASTMGQVSQSGESGAGYTMGEGRKSRLRDHVWLFTYYERPTRRYPRGRVLHFCGKDMKFLRSEEQLPYAKLDYNGQPLEWCSGISYFHYWRVTGQFWSRSLVENLKDGNRAYDKRRTQINEIIDRGMPAVFVREGSEALKRTDQPLEMISLGMTEQRPDFFTGIGPGDWIYKEIERLELDMERASGIRAPALGENPTNVITLGQLSLLRESDQVKRQPTMIDRKRAIEELVKYIVYDIRQYWGREKHIVVAGEDDMVEATTFDATKIPPFFIVKVAKGSAKPRSQGAELTKIDQIWNGAVASGVMVNDPQGWIQWLYDSLEAGQALQIPSAGLDSDQEKAETENHKMFEGEEVPVAYYDNIAVHLPIHRAAQIEAELAGEFELWTRLERHIQEHLQAQVLNMEASQADARPEPLEEIDETEPEPQ